MSTLFPFADRVRVVLFDAGNTLLWIDHARVAGLLAESGIETDEPAVRDAEMRARPLLDPHLGHAPKRETPEIFGRYLNYVLDNLGLPPDDSRRAVAAGPVRDVWRRLWTGVPADAVSTLDTLRDRGYRLGVVSNSDGTVEAQLVAAGLRDHVECVIDSGVVGVEKPDPGIFAFATAELGEDADRCAYVGDFHSIDVLGARAAGIAGILMDPIGAWAGFDAPKIGALGELLERLPDAAPSV